MSLYNKYRPQKPDELLGNDGLGDTLKRYFAKPDHNHTIFLAGDSGTGKSTVAYIIAKEILGADPVSIKEINASKDKEKEAVEPYVEQSLNMPMVGDVQVFIFNECHYLTPSAKALLLEATEDVKPYSYFIFTTTNEYRFLKGDKGEKTNALSTRCMKFTLRPLDDRDAYSLIDIVLEGERSELPDAIKDEIVSMSSGSGRLIVNNVEKCLCASDEDAMHALLNGNSANEDDPNAIELCRALVSARPSWSSVAKRLKELKAAGVEAESVRRTVAGYMQSILLGGTLDKHALHVLEIFCNNTYDTGFPQLVAMCGEAVNG